MASVGHRDEAQTAFRHQEQIGELMLAVLSGIESAGQMVWPGRLNAYPLAGVRWDEPSANAVQGRS